MWKQKDFLSALSNPLLSSNRTISSSNLAAFINYSATFAVTFLLSLYLQGVRGISPQQQDPSF